MSLLSSIALGALGALGGIVVQSVFKKVVPVPIQEQYKKHFKAYSKALLLACVISSIVMFCMSAFDGKTALTEIPSLLGGVLFILLIICLVSFMLTVIPFLIIIWFVQKYKTLMPYILGGIFTASPLWGFILVGCINGEEHHIQDHVWFGLYFVALGAFCGGFHHWLLYKKPSPRFYDVL